MTRSHASDSAIARRDEGDNVTDGLELELEITAGRSDKFIAPLKTASEPVHDLLFMLMFPDEEKLPKRYKPRGL